MQSAVLVENDDRQFTFSAGALGRSLTLLQALAGADGPRNLTALVGLVGLPKTTTHRLLQSLLANDLVTRSRSGYSLGHRMYDLAELVRSREAELRRSLMPFLVNLYERTGQVVRLGVLRGDDCVYLETLRGHRHAGTLGSFGDRLPAHTTAAGKLLLAYRDQGPTLIPRQRPLPRLTTFTVVDPQRLAEELTLIPPVRTRGLHAGAAGRADHGGDAGRGQGAHPGGRHRDRRRREHLRSAWGLHPAPADRLRRVPRPAWPRPARCPSGSTGVHLGSWRTNAAKPVGGCPASRS